MGWGGDVSIRCEVDMEVEATPYHVVTLSWKYMLVENTLEWGGVGWGGDVRIRCEVDMEVEATPYDAVKLSWKLMQDVHNKDLTVRPPHFCDLANSWQITIQN